MRLAVLSCVIGILLVLVLLSSCSRLLPGGVGGPVGSAGRAGDYIVTLMSTQEGRLPSLKGDPEGNRYRLSLMLHPVDGGSPTTIALADGLRQSDYMHSARILGDDGQRVWFHAHEPMAYDYKNQRLIRNERMSRPGISLSAPDAKDFLEKDPASPLKKAAWLLDKAYGKPIVLNAAGDRLRTHRSANGIFGSVVLSRVTTSGAVVWSVDTNFLDLDQVLPDTRNLALVGRYMPVKQDEVRGPNLMLIDLENGRKHERSLWLR